MGFNLLFNLIVISNSKWPETALERVDTAVHNLNAARNMPEQRLYMKIIVKNQDMNYIVPQYIYLSVSLESIFVKQII